MADENTTTPPPAATPTPAAAAVTAPAATPAPATDPVTPPEAANDPIKHISEIFKRPFTEVEVGSMVTWAEGKGNPALDTMLEEMDSDDAKVANKALETLVNVYNLAAAQQPTGTKLSQRVKKAALASTAHQPAAPAPAAGPTVEDVTKSLVDNANKTGREPTPAEVLAAHGIKL